MNKLRVCVCVFSRTPVPGKTKTRLIPVLGDEGACELHCLLLQQTLNTAVSCGFTTVRLYCTPSISHPYLQECAGQFGLELRTQQGTDLGQRMQNAISESLQDHDIVIVTGCDSPDLARVDLQETVEKLLAGAQVVIGPAHDGGYYLIACRTSQTGLFCDIEWGSDSVLEDTRNKLRSQVLSWSELLTRHDIDRPEDLVYCEELLAETN